MATFYLRIEGVNLGHVLGDTDQLSVVRGASLLLRQAVKDVANQFGGLEPIATGASTGLFRFSADDDGHEARKVRDDVAKFLNTDRLYQHFTFVVDVYPEDRVFKTDKEAIIALNRLRQVQQLSLAVPPRNTTNSAPCQLDGKRPGEVTLDVERDEEQPTVSASVAQRHDYGRTEKQRFYREEIEGICDDQQILDLKFAHDLHEIAGNRDYVNLNDKMAVIYFDGNDFGGIQARHCQNANGLQGWDQYIQNARRQFLCDFLKSYKTDEEFFIEVQTKRGIEKRMRLETLLWGGDEITLVVPAWRGLQVLHYFYEKSQAWTFAGEPLTHAGGIVFCHVKTPIYRMRALAKELAEHVKETPGGRNSNYYEYMVLESIDYPAEKLTKFWERRYGSTLVTRRSPLKPINGYHAWQPQLAQVLEEVPRGQVYAVARAAFGDPGAGPNADAFEKQLKRFETLVDETVPSKLSNWLKELFPTHDPLWPWLHLEELWDYLAPEKKKTDAGLSASASGRAVA